MVYNKNATLWHQDRGGNKRSVILSDAHQHFKSLLPSGKILEVGCGVGEDAQALATLGYNYIGTDISEEFIKVASANNPNPTFIQSSLYQLDFPDNEFDGFWCVATLLHIPKTKINTALTELRRVLKINAIGFITLINGEGEKIDATGRLFSYYRQEEFTAILRNHSFTVVETSTDTDNKGNLWLQFYIKAV